MHRPEHLEDIKPGMWCGVYGESRDAPERTGRIVEFRPNGVVVTVEGYATWLVPFEDVAFNEGEYLDVYVGNSIRSAALDRWEEPPD